MIGGVVASLTTATWAVYRFRYENRRAAAAQTTTTVVRTQTYQELPPTVNDHRTLTAADAVSDSMTMTFVDAMRLLYVLSSAIAANANENRFAEFVQVANRHFSDLRSELAHFGSALPPHLEEKTVEVDKRLSYLIAELDRRRREEADRLFRDACELSDVVHSFVRQAVPSRFADMSSLFEAVRTTMISDLDYRVRTMSRDDVFMLRLSLQSELLELHASGNERLRSIAHDAKQRLGLPYFLIDYALLHRMKL